MRSRLHPLLGNRTLLAVALDVQMTKLGSKMRDPKEQRLDEKYLRVALNTWTRSSCPRAQRFDRAVKELIKASLVGSPKPRRARTTSRK